MYIVLASKSPRRKEILERFGIKFTCIEANINEEKIKRSERDEISCVKKLAIEKGMTVLFLLENDPDAFIIAADTLVSCRGSLLGKPKNREEARRMLSMLSGRTNKVYSGVFTHYRGAVSVCACVTAVTFATLTAQDIENYLDTPEPYDKAGAYAIQGLASAFITNIAGNYDNVVGFPTQAFCEMIQRAYGVSVWDLQASEEIARLPRPTNEIIKKKGV